MLRPRPIDDILTYIQTMIHEPYEYIYIHGVMIII